MERQYFSSSNLREKYWTKYLQKKHIFLESYDFFCAKYLEGQYFSSGILRNKFFEYLEKCLVTSILKKSNTLRDFLCQVPGGTIFLQYLGNFWPKYLQKNMFFLVYFGFFVPSILRKKRVPSIFFCQKSSSTLKVFLCQVSGFFEACSKKEILL